MRRSQSILSAGFVCSLALDTLLPALQWSTRSARVSPRLLVQLLIRAAAQVRSLSAIVQEAAAAPAWETVRSALNACLPDHPDDLLPATTRALHARLPKSLRRRPRTLAIDLHLRPYYGVRRTPGIYRGQAKAGTTTFFAYATVLVIHHGQSYTLGLTPVVKGQEQTAYLARLLEQVETAGVHVRRLLLDRGFYAATTLRWLQERSVAFVVPMIRRGKAGRSKATCTGTARFFVRGRRGWDKYTWTARPLRRGRKQSALVVSVAVCMVSRKQAGGGPRGRRGRRRGPLVYVCHGVAITTAPGQVARWYRQRFGIETSYRQLGQGLAATCSTNRVYRLLLVAIALVLRNVWVWLHGHYLAERRRGRLRLHLEKLRVMKMMSWLIAVLNRDLDIRPQAINIDQQLSNEALG